MTMRLLWFVLAGFLLGFAASTLWEWLHFRRERMKLRDSRVQELEVQLAEEQRILTQMRVVQQPAPVWPQADYHSPGVFLDSESPEVSPVYAPESIRAPAEPVPKPPDSIPKAPAHESRPVAAPVVEDEPQESDVPEPAFEEEADDHATTLERLAAELVRSPADPAPAANREFRQRYVQRSTDYPDDLSKIKGIGDVYKYRLYAAGIFTWHQIAETDEDTLRVATNAYPGSNVDEWAGQARELAKKNKREDAYYTGPVPDNLTKIVGIGPVGERTLYRAGICTFDQLAGATVNELHDLFPIAIAGDEPDFNAWIRLAIELANRKARTIGGRVMDQNPFQQPPYFDWSLDRWKVAIIVILFLVLLVSTLFDPGWGGGTENAGPK